MMKINHVTAILSKDVKDVIKNIQVLILFVVYPVVGFIMTQSINVERGFFISVFATMHFVFTPIVVSAHMISEEKEKNTLRVLRMSGITSGEFFVSTAVFILSLDCITGSTFIFMAGEGGIDPGLYYSAAIMGCVVSIMLGMCIGTFSKSSSGANGLAIPLGLFFSFLPMLSYFNKGLESVSKYLYGQQVGNMIYGKGWSAETGIICLANLLLVMGLYVLLYRRIKTQE